MSLSAFLFKPGRRFPPTIPSPKEPSSLKAIPNPLGLPLFTRTRTELSTDLLPRSVQRILLWHGVRGSHCRPLQTQWQVWGPGTLVRGHLPCNLSCQDGQEWDWGPRRVGDLAGDASKMIPIRYLLTSTLIKPITSFKSFLLKARLKVNLCLSEKSLGAQTQQYRVIKGRNHKYHNLHQSKMRVIVTLKRYVIVEHNNYFKHDIQVIF